MGFYVLYVGFANYIAIAYRDELSFWLAYYKLIFWLLPFLMVMFTCKKKDITSILKIILQIIFFDREGAMDWGRGSNLASTIVLRPRQGQLKTISC